MASLDDSHRFEAPASLRGRFAALLSAFAALPAQEETIIRLSAVRMAVLLGRFIDLQKLAQASAEVAASKNLECFRGLLAGYENTLSRYRQMQEKVADDFNLLEVMRLTGKE